MAFYRMATELETSHEHCSGKVCVVCYGKSYRSVSSGDAEIIKQHIIDGYSTTNADFPNGICTGCSVSLSKKWKDPSFIIPNQIENYDPGRKTGLRSCHECVCRICTVAKTSGFYMHHQRKNKKKRGRPPVSKTTPIAFKVCGNCFAKLYRGCNHSSEQCKSRRNKVDILVEMTSPTSLNRAASRVNTQETQSTPLGRPARSDEAKRELFSASDICGMSQDLQLTGKKVKTLVSDIRLSTGSRKSVERKAIKVFQEKRHQLDEFFEVTTLVYKVKNAETKVDENVERHSVLCNDVSAFIDSILEKRDREWGDNMLLRIGLDGGGGFFKIILSIFDKDDPYPNVNSALSKKFKESGVKKAFIIALVPAISENYVNVKRLWINLKLQDLRFRKFTVATDLKLCNIILGMMNHSSCHPCCWCDTDKDSLNKKGTPRTIGNLMKLFWAYFESGCSKDKARNFGNVIHQPMFNNDESDDTPVIQLLPPPELHLMTGPVNTMLDGLESVWTESEKWLKSCNVKKTEYHGGQLTGNDSRRLLKNVSKINQPTGIIKRYADAFIAFNDVVDSCYGDELKENYKTKIRLFAKAYQHLRINITPKVHAVIFHIEEFCSLTHRGLAPWSEQAGEAMHHDFSEMWDDFKVKNMENPIYPDHLLQAVCAYNGQHV